MALARKLICFHDRRLRCCLCDTRNLHVLDFTRILIASSVCFRWKACSHSIVARQGEVTVVVEGKDKEAMSAAMDELEHELDELMRQGVSPSQAAKIVATAHQLPRGQIYSMALERGKQQS